MRTPMLLLAGVFALAGCNTHLERHVRTPAAAPVPAGMLGAASSGDVAAGSEAPTMPGAMGEATLAEASVPATPNAEPITEDEVPPLEAWDPWERFNRGVYRFNARFDEAIFLPVAEGYREFVPGPVRSGIHNFFANLREVGTVLNYALQGRLGQSGRSLGRLLLNTTIGVGGLFDVAGHLGLPAAPTGFGDTLAHWGVDAGPYLVLPFYGPSTLRDGIGSFGDLGAVRAVDAWGLYTSDGAWAVGATDAVDTRANIPFRYYATGAAFDYELTRFLYTRKRLLETEGTAAGSAARADEAAAR
ncbi:MlaA family lipoprotein [Coralloluteibacterium stylophorae]|uniref:VacJ family lipoprotein n=1 Tax=Coralloluteibacterium stylophorae TaxID=1776034 RepID=A0A8J7VT62_9GAMM|nr:VacJ family lipoprotein [Coralloluteibacterium stylophorae]MBS7456288.1 VacJ family lipoprotein [Coralloluteibacterium stylophorae]